MNRDSAEAILKEIGCVGCYAPGNYFGKCCVCDREFIGDKRAIHCLPCAVKEMQKALCRETQERKRYESFRDAIGAVEAAIEAIKARPEMKGPFFVNTLSPETGK